MGVSYCDAGSHLFNMKRLILLAVSCLCFVARAQTIGSTNITLQSYITVGTVIGSANSQTNYALDFNRTNSRGYYIYQSVNGTNHVYFQYTTNATTWRLISINVFANGGDRQIGIPTNLPHLNTNGLTLAGNYYILTLTNQNEFRITLETNGVTMSTLWAVFGQ